MNVQRIVLCIIGIASLLLTACRNEDPGSSDQVVDPVTPNVEETVLLSQSLESLSWWQDIGNSPEEIIAYGSKLPDQPITIGIHGAEATAELTFKQHMTIDSEQLQPLVRAVGADVVVTEGDAPHVFEVTISGVQDKADIYLGDLQQIRLIHHQNHLDFILNQSALQHPYSLLVPSEADGRSHIFVSDREESVVIRFTAPMQRIERLGTEWLSDTQLLIDVAETEGMLDLSDYYAQEGNFINRKLAGLVIHLVPDRTWLNAASGGSVGWSHRDTYYDLLLFSSDNTKYAGTVKLSEDTDGDGAYHGIIIEQQGKAPLILRDTIHVHSDTGVLPIAWKDSRTLLYLSEHTVRAYNLEDNTSRIVPAGEGDQAVAFDYDASTGRLYVLMQSIEQGEGGKYDVRIDLATYADDLVTVESRQQVAAPQRSNEIETMPLDIALLTSDIYVTTVRGGETVTVLIRDGVEAGQAAGRLIGTTDNGAYLQDTGQNGDLGWWPRSSEAVTITPFADATAYIMFGGDLFAYREGEPARYYGYSMTHDEWLEWSPNDGRDSWVPNQRTAYYRIVD